MANVPDWLLHTPVAHRGLHDAERGIPENSLAAFAAAASRGFAAELDVRLLRDGRVIVFHDVDFVRMAGAELQVAEATFEAVQELSLLDTPHAVPLLGDALRLTPELPFLIEVKNEGAVGALEDAVAEALSSHGGPVALQSFNRGTVSWFREHLPHFSCGFLTSSALDGARDADFVGIDVRAIPDEALAALRDGGMPVLAWTVRSATEARRVRAHCDNIIFESFIPPRPSRR